VFWKKFGRMENRKIGKLKNGEVENFDYK